MTLALALTLPALAAPDVPALVRDLEGDQPPTLDHVADVLALAPDDFTAVRPGDYRAVDVHSGGRPVNLWFRVVDRAEIGLVFDSRTSARRLRHACTELGATWYGVHVKTHDMRTPRHIDGVRRDLGLYCRASSPRGEWIVGRWMDEGGAKLGVLVGWPEVTSWTAFQSAPWHTDDKPAQWPLDAEDRQLRLVSVREGDGTVMNMQIEVDYRLTNHSDRSIDARVLRLAWAYGDEDDPKRLVRIEPDRIEAPAQLPPTATASGRATFTVERDALNHSSFRLELADGTLSAASLPLLLR